MSEYHANITHATLFLPNPLSPCPNTYIPYTYTYTYTSPSLLSNTHPLSKSPSTFVSRYIINPMRNPILAPRSNIINRGSGINESGLSGLDTRVFDVAVRVSNVVVEAVDAVGTAVCQAGG